MASGAILRAFTGGATSVAFSPDGKYILTGSAGKTAILWESGIQPIAGTTAPPTNIAVSTSAPTLAPTS
ncbi:MAG: hypothetical protein ACYDBJ_22755 [Aggregatilineales bacterium]